MGLWKDVRRRIEGIGVDRRLDLSLRREYFGNRKGGWWLFPEELNASSIVYSVGIGENLTFDLALIERFGLTMHAFDPTPHALAYVASRSWPPELKVHPWGLAHYDGTAGFRPSTDPREPSHTLLEDPEREVDAVVGSVYRLESLASRLGHAAIDVLKMDIEGAEYEVIEDLSRSAIRPTQILVEFHHRFHGVGVARTNSAIRLLREIGYGLYSVSESGREYSFRRN